MPVFNYNFLYSFCINNNISLLKKYSNENITRETRIEGKCLTDNCLNHFNKSFRQLIKVNGYCESCSKTNALQKRNENIDEIIKKRQETIKNKDGGKYNKILLNTLVNKYNIELLTDYSNIKLNCRSIIEGKCINFKECSNNFSKRFDAFELYNGYCNECSLKVGNSKKNNEEINNKRKNTMLERYGSECIFTTEKFKENQKNNFDVRQEKYIATSLEKYGKQSPSQNEDVKLKVKNTNIQKYGVKHYSQTKEFSERYKETSQKNWGTDYPAQNAEIFAKTIKSAYTKKDYVFPSKKIIQIQGYEHFALDKLLIEDKVDEEDIITGIENVPEVWYYDNERKKHRYYVDIYIPSKNLCIEVKSKYTKDNTRFLEEKQKSIEDLGYKYEIWIFNTKGIIIS